MGTADLSPKLRHYFSDYQFYHQNKVNLFIHKWAIPLIVFHIVAMLNWITIYDFGSYAASVSQMASVGVLVFYFSLDFFLALLMFLFIILCHLLAAVTPVSVVLIIAGSAWFVQLLGHQKWEKKSPAFTKNLIQLLIGPLFVLEMLTKKRF